MSLDHKALPSVGPSGNAVDFAAPDSELAERLRRGDIHALVVVMRRYNRRLFRVVRSVMSDEAEAQDVVQETYIKAFRKIHQYLGPDAFGAWLCKIAINEARERLRAKQRLVPMDRTASGEDDEPVGETVGEIAPNPFSPEQIAMAGEIRVLLERAIEALPPDFRAVFVMRAIEEMSIAETAACLDIPEATVKTRLHRARAALQRALRPHVEDALGAVFPFGGERCDRIVRTVLARLEGAVSVPHVDESERRH